MSAVIILEAPDERTPEVARALLVAWITLSYVICGLITWWQRPASHFGPLMAAAGFAPFLSTLSASSADLPHTIGEVFRRLPIVVFMHLYLSYPTGRLPARFDRALVTASYVLVLGLALVSLLLGRGGPHNLLEVVDRPGAADIVSRAEAFGLFLVMLAAILVLLRRWRGSGRTLRRSGNVVRGSFMLALVALSGGGLVAAQAGSAEVVRLFTFGLVAIAPVAFMSRLLSARLARSSVGDLFLALHADPAPADLRDALARALRDPSVELAYWLPEFASYADLEGRVVELPDDEDQRAMTLIDRGGVQVAALMHDAALRDEPRTCSTAVTAAAGIALENARLQAELPGSSRGAAGVARANRRSRPQGAPAAGARPARRRAAAAGCALARAEAAGGAARGRPGVAAPARSRAA